MVERIPLEVVVKYTELGGMRPIKIICEDKLYPIEKVYNQKLSTPKGSYAVALEFDCLINGKRKKIYFDRYESLWFSEKIGVQK